MQKGEVSSRVGPLHHFSCSYILSIIAFPLSSCFPQIHWIPKESLICTWEYIFNIGGRTNEKMRLSISNLGRHLNDKLTTLISFVWANINFSLFT